MSKLWCSKLTAFSIHILFSALIIGIFMLVVTQLWFPDILFSLENVWEGLQILIPVDAILGPLLTLVLFVPGKKGLLGDLIIIAVLQILALVYGGYTIYNQRPEVIVFAADRFEIVPSSKFNKENLNSTYFDSQSNSQTKPYPFIVYALPGQTTEERSQFVLNNTQFQKMPERYRPLIEYKDKIIKKSLTLSKFVPASEQSKKILRTFKAKYKELPILLFRIEGTTSVTRVIALDANNLQLVGFLDLDPWTDYLP